MSIYVAPRPARLPVKAATGVGVNYWNTDVPLSALSRTPQERMRQAMKLGISVPWIRAAERAITGPGSTVPWHLEDGDDVEVDDEYNGLEAQRARALIERPQALLPLGQKLSRREMWALTLRHVGLCGNSFWVDDMPDTDGLPGALLYVRPDRMTPAPDDNGNLRGWVIDYDQRGGGIPYHLDQVHHFTLEPPDEGYFGVGLVESALVKASLSGALDTYLLQKIQAGGRRSGILAPKAGIIEPDVYQQLINDWRVASEAQDSARRLQVVRAPVDFHDTGIDELTNMLRDFMTGARDDLLGLWGVPASKLGLHDRGKGLGATSATESDDESLWENAINPRLIGMAETIQMTLLDDFQRIGTTVELEIEYRVFDDDAPQYEKAAKAVGQPLTNNQRLEILGFDPLPDYGPDGEPLGLAIMMPMTYTVVAQGPEDNGKFTNAPLPEPPPVVTEPPPQLLPGELVKATPTQKLRAKVEATTTPKLRSAVAKFLDEQKREIVAKLRAHASHIAKEPKEWQTWFGRPEKWDRKLAEALRPHLAKMATVVSDHIATAMPAKAEPQAGAATGATAVERVLQRGLARVQGINTTTRDTIVNIILRTIENGGSVLDAADEVEAATAFDEARSEMIARTELMDAYNFSAISTYEDFGVTRVQAIDGDQDPECAERDGQTYSIEEAFAIEDHPNGTLDWVPIVDIPKAAPSVVIHNYPHDDDHRAPAKAEDLTTLRDALITAFSEQTAAIRALPAPVVNVAAPVVHVPAPVVNVAAPEVSIPAPIVNVPAPIVNVPEPLVVMAPPRDRTVRKNRDGSYTVHEL